MAESDAERRVGGRYRLDGEIGRGGMGTVWAAHDELLRRDVAIKEVLPPQGLDEEERGTIRERTMREARAAARISSPGAVTVYDVVEEDAHPWIVMERLPGRTLDDVLQERGRLQPREAARLGVALLDALDAAHSSGVLHRDLKPGNVLFRSSDDMSRVVLTDFGIAHLDGDASLTTTGMLTGSPAYVAPERARGEAATRASDLWSLGATLWTAVEGEPPFLRDGPLPTLTAVVTEDVPEPQHAGPLGDVLLGLLQKDPDERIDCATALRRLREVAESGGARRVESAPAPVAPPDERAQAEASRSGGTLSVPVVPVDDAAGDGADEGPADHVAGDPSDEPEPEPDQADAGRQAAAAPVVRADEPAPRGRPSDDPAPRPRPATTGTTSSSSARPALVAGAVLALLAAVGLGAWVLSGPGGDDGGSPGTPVASASASPASAEDEGEAAGGQTAGEQPQQATTPPPPTSEEDPSASPSASAEGSDSAAAVPEGFERYSDPTGFSVAVPEDWTVNRESPRVRFSDPDSSTYLLVDQTDTPAADPLADWQRQEQAVSQRLSNYERVSLEGITWRGWEGADWEFTHGSGTHVLNRNLVTSEDQAYALYWSAPDARWEQSLETFQQIAQSFQPAG